MQKSDEGLRSGNDLRKGRTWTSENIGHLCECSYAGKMDCAAPHDRLPSIPKPFMSPPGGWYIPARDGYLNVSGHDLVACGLKGAEIGYVLAKLAKAVTTKQVPNEPEDLLALVPQYQSEFPERPKQRFRIRPHAVRRYIERVNASLSYWEARYEMDALCEEAPFSRKAPDWTLLSERDKVRGGYLEVADGICFALHDGIIRTVLTRELVEESPPGDDPFPTIFEDRPDPAWPERRYVANHRGEIECRTILDGTLLVATGRSTYAAWRQLRDKFIRLGQRRQFEAGQRDYSSRRKDEASHLLLQTRSIAQRKASLMTEA